MQRHAIVVAYAASQLLTSTLAMQEPIPTTKSNQINSLENRYSEILFIKLRGNPIQPEQIDLHLIINFNEQWQELPGGKVKVGLKGGELKFNLENGRMPYESRLNRLLEMLVTKESQIKEGNENQSGFEASLTENKPGIKANLSGKITTEKTDKFQFTSSQITTKGSEEDPIWVFEVKTGEPVFKGTFNVNLGTLNVTAKPCRVKATFGVSLRDVHFTDAEGLWSPEISQEKRAVLDRGLAKLLLKRKLQPYLSQVELRYV